MSPSRWGEVFLMLGMVIGVMALPQQPSPSFPSSMALARERRQLGSRISDKELQCLLSTSDDGIDGSFCSSLRDENFSPTPTPRIVLLDGLPPTQIPPITHSSRRPPTAPLRQRPAPLTVANPDAAPAPSCRCVPHWQCKDKKLSQVVEGDSLTSFALDLRSNSGCGAPEEVCCVEVDINAPPPTVPLVNPLCGERNTLGVGNTFLGFEDQQSQFGEFPWTVAIVSSRGFGSSAKPLYVSGGSLIHPRVVLTVAHSIRNHTADNLKVRLGEWNLATPTEVVAHQEIQVRQVLIHPGYHKVHQYYDVALLLLDQPAVIGATVNTICLPSPRQDYRSEECVVSGWGKKHFDEKSRFQRVMKKVSLPLVGNAPCQTALQGTRLGVRFILHDSFVCAGGQKEGQDACTGDGGSPLVCRLQSDPRRYVQVGVVAWGIGCGSLGVPGVYADVVKARPWIDQVIGESFGNTSGKEGVPLDLRTFAEV